MTSTSPISWRSQENQQNTKSFDAYRLPSNREYISDRSPGSANTSPLHPDERLPLSTKILESSFARYKQLEGQQAKSGFTNLLLTFPTLLKETTAAEVVACFAVAKVADIKAWTQPTSHTP